MIAVVGIALSRKKAAQKVNEVLGQFANLILGRMGIPSPQQDLALIALIVQGKRDELAALTGKLGNIKDVRVRLAVTSEEKF
ncbi:MAG: CopG family transcriptional regulator [Firmicutes bacterium]|nr:CopG family transcriptional regulator [Bacillota bacterium]HOB21446.1 CopG family transcriptional regulator [Bacillota bacterium]HQD40041.1 CopG family transcriptional regulator [Bacillota bacterium]